MQLPFIWSNFQAGVMAIAMVALSINQTAAQSSNRSANWEGIVQLVKAGDEIALDPSTLQLANNILTVKWSQNLSGRKADYHHIVATFSSNSAQDVMSVFVQRDHVDDFLSKCGVGSDNYCTMRVDRDFQYGESASRSFRFLVFHDKKSKPDMRRFIGQKSAGRFAKSGRQLVNELDRKDLIPAVSFTSTRYRQKSSKVIFGNNGGLRDFDASTNQPKWSLERFSKDRQIALVDQKGRYCLKTTVKIFGTGGKYSDGSRAPNRGKEFQNRCLRWERQAWTKLASSPKREVKPAELGRTEFAMRQCVEKADRDHGHRSNDQKRLRAKAAYRCEITRKRALLLYGADPTIGYNYGRGAKIDAFFAGGSWRLKR